MQRTGTFLRYIWIIGIGAGVSFGATGAVAFEIKVDSKQDQSYEKTSLNGQSRDSLGLLTVKFSASLWNIDPTGMGALASSDSANAWDRSQFLNQAVRNTLSDTRVTVGMFDDWVRFTSRQAVSDYIKTGADPGIFVRTGLGSENIATSQHIDAGVWKSELARVSVFAEYDRVGEYFQTPNFAIKPDDLFSTPNSTTTRFGGTVERGPLAFTLEQRIQRSLTQDNAPTFVDNRAGVSLSFDALHNRSGWFPESLSWTIPSSAYFNVGQGRVKAALDQGVNGDTTSDFNTGLSWSAKNFYANLGYWQYDYKSELYPWKGSGINGSVGYYEDQWAISFYFNVYNSATSYPVAGLQQSATYNNTYGGVSFSTHF